MSIDHEYQDAITCPECGYKQSDSWECCDGEYEHECDCGCTYISIPNPSITFCTHPIKTSKEAKYD